MNTTCPMLKQNEGSIDRMIRIIVGVVLLLVGMFALTGVIQTVVLVVSAVALITGAIGFCGLYAIFGISTKKHKK